MIDGSHTHSGVCVRIDGTHTHSGAFYSSTMCLRSINHKKAPLCV
jgi:hypothetical protein